MFAGPSSRRALAWLVTLPDTAVVAASMVHLEGREARWFLPETSDVLGLLVKQVSRHLIGGS
jgi:hypothetical protein